MTYDLAMWEGSAPASPAAAAAEYERRMYVIEAALDQAGRPPPATPTIRAFVEAALARYPDLDEDSGDECPWASSPLISEAVGDFICLPMTFQGAEYARDVVASIAKEQGLVCYDPQVEQLLPAAHKAPPKETWLRRVFRRG
ncbi:hypothetical protein ABN028_20285 [Actinopolymorpha sp. B17G11]|uniref:hypothetical protein n=1 Tax=Actinopolymorpha sp. B17G11 TaxID=3160861 RepID=UPI0032E40210